MAVAMQKQHRRWAERERESSPDRSKVWSDPANSNSKPKVVSVVYYLSRNGQLEHPHFIEVPLSSPPDGLFLKDVINRLNVLRGKAMPSSYSWSSKRSYRNGFVWHDLSENDFIYPAHGNEYVLKGSELQHSDPKVLHSASSRSLKPPPEVHPREFPSVARRRNQSWSSIDLHEYKVYKTESVGDSAAAGGKSSSSSADAATQTDEKRGRRRTMTTKAKAKEEEEIASTELGRGEISPPPSESSPETLESLMKADGRLVISSAGGEDGGVNRTAEVCPSGKAARASTVLMQLLSCGSASFKNCGPALVKDHGMSLIAGKGRVTRGGVKLEDKEYFSGSLVETCCFEAESETNKADLSSLQRSTSYNADRSSRLEVSEEELGVLTKCIPRKPRGVTAKKESSIITSGDNSHGSSRRHEVVNI